MAKNTKKGKRKTHAPTDTRIKILAEYDKSAGLYRDYACRVRDLIETILNAKKIKTDDRRSF